MSQPREQAAVAAEDSPAREMDGLEDRIRRHLDGGDLSAAATELVRGYGPRILSYLVSILGNESTAEDVFGRFCENVWRGIGGFEQRSSARTWAFEVAWRAALEHIRNSRRRPFRRLETDEISRIAAEVCSSVVRLEKAEDDLAKLRQQLDPEERSILILHVDQRMSWEEVAQVLSARGEKIAAAALRKRFERLKSKIRKMAEDEGLIETAEPRRREASLPE